MVNKHKKVELDTDFVEAELDAHKKLLFELGLKKMEDYSPDEKKLAQYSQDAIQNFVKSVMEERKRLGLPIRPMEEIMFIDLLSMMKATELVLRFGK